MKPQKRGLIVIAVSLFLLAFASFSALAVGGCYIYPEGSEELYCVPNVEQSVAAEDCAEHADCTMQDDFLPGNDCSTLAECQEVVCSADCQTHARGVCEELGGQEVADESYAAWCSPGCCKISTDQFCQFGLNRYQCEQRAQQLGYDPTSSQVIYDNSPGMNLAECNRLYCQVEVLPAQLSGVIRDSAGAPVAGATVTIEGTTQQAVSESAGHYSFTNLRPGTIVVRVSAADYLPSTLSLTLQPGASVEQDFVLSTSEGIASLRGSVRAAGQPLADATVTWSGPASGRTSTDPQGEYAIADLPSGTYELSASKVGYRPASQSITLYASEETRDFTLEAVSLQGLQGITYVDEQGNGIADTSTEFRYGVRLYVDGIFRGFSQYPGGEFSLSIAPGSHEISATYQDFFFGPEQVDVPEGQTPYNILLTRYIGECTSPNPLRDVAIFSASPVPGEKSVLLQWQRPCPEVVGYTIEKSSPDAEMEFAPIPRSVVQSTYTDINVEWGATYTYAIRALYRDGNSPAATETTITLGDEECEGRFDALTGWDTFCLVGDVFTRKTVWSCSDSNQLIPSLNCAERDGEGEDFYCSVVSPGEAECKDAGICSVQGMPFGLYYARDACYGTASPPAENFCYYDYSDSIVNECRNCLDVASCFEYRSKDACEFNSCIDASCQWADAAANHEPLIDYGLINLPLLVSTETGQGYCVEEGYEGDDTCSLCSPQATLFENYYCTSQVCSSLGRCFATTDVSSCNSCGEFPASAANCYTYNSELECTGGRAISRSPFGELTLSEDQCGWGRCLWQGAPDSFASGACVKDGDGNLQNDCAAFTASGERRGCEIDNSPPRTTIVPAGVPIVSLVSPNVTFFGDDDFHPAGSQNNKLGLLGFCATPIDPNAPSVCTDFTEVSYPGNLKQEMVTINLIASSYLQRQSNGEPYQLKFYSQDKYFNRENVQEAFVFVDNVAPEFEISEQIETAGDITDLTVYLQGISEPMGCDFLLQQVLPLGGSQSRAVAREEPNKEVSFGGLTGVIYALNVTCEDAVHNTNTKSKSYVFDLEKRIIIVQPAAGSVVASSQIQFTIETVAGAQCTLYDARSNTPILDFTSDEQGKQHQTIAVPGFVEGEYPGTHKAVCRELLSDETYEDYFHFTVDFTPPATEIILREGQREERPLGYGWEEFFVEEVAVDFACSAEGFPCEQTFYCLGEGCDYIRHPGYTEYSGTVEVTESAQICYYSTDAANNPVYSPICGTLTIDGYGITLLAPEQHYYQDVQWGVSNTPTFTWSFLTKVPTEECRFDFNPNFSWDATPGFKVLRPDNSNIYTLPEFPEGTGSDPYPSSGGVKAVYVKCRNSAGEIGPEEKMSLEYDPSAPSITDAHAEPEELLEGNTVELFTTTDDKTMCKYSDQGHEDYALMNYAFPGGEADILGAAGREPKLLQELHQDTYSVAGFLGLQREYILNVLCRNGARDLSGLEHIKFNVDYTQRGGIISAWPQGEHLNANEVTLSVETSKSALCEYRANETFFPLSSADRLVHRATISNLQERYYQYPVRCAMGDHVAEAEVFFTIDRTPPRISRVDDGSYTCGKDAINVMVYSDEQNITAYAYSVYDTGISSTPTTGLAAGSNTSSFRRSTSFGGTRRLVANGSTSPELPIVIPLSALRSGSNETNETMEGHRVVAEVRAQDAAGWSLPVESDGVLIVSAEHAKCLNDTAAPMIRVQGNESCTAKAIELHCEDAIGCWKMQYGQSLTQDSCNAATTYMGRISFSSGGWLCYYAEDYQGRNHSAAVQVQRTDADGDGITDSCDQCSTTSSGLVVDAVGCSLGQVPGEEQRKDTDGDGLPDYWEKSYDAVDCPLNYVAIDTDQNTIPDGEEDYDSDGLANYEEYRAGRNPCLADAPPAREEERLPPGTLPSLPGEQPDVLAWIFFIAGWLFIAGGAGYLIYYYRYAPRRGAGAAARPFATAALPVEEKPALGRAWEKLAGVRRKYAEKHKERERRELFGAFGKSSPEIPHVGKVLEKDIPPEKKIAQAAKVYAEHKEEIAPGLRAGEKSIFEKLEKIAARGSARLEKPLKKSDAEDIFGRLQALARKRKK